MVTRLPGESRAPRSNYPTVAPLMVQIRPNIVVTQPGRSRANVRAIPHLTGLRSENTELRVSSSRPIVLYNKYIFTSGVYMLR